MNSILRFASDTAALGAFFLGLSLAVGVLTQAMHAGFKFVTVDKLPLHVAIPLALLYPIASPARLVRRVFRHRQQVARAASMAAHPAGKAQAQQEARAASMAAHPSSNRLTAVATGRHLHLVSTRPTDAA